MVKNIIPYHKVRELFSYDQAIGHLSWKKYKKGIRKKQDSWEFNG